MLTTPNYEVLKFPHCQWQLILEVILETKSCVAVKDLSSPVLLKLFFSIYVVTLDIEFMKTHYRGRHPPPVQYHLSVFLK